MNELTEGLPKGVSQPQPELSLLQHRPVWDVGLLLLSGAGLLIAAAGMVMGWQRLRS